MKQLKNNLFTILAGSFLILALLTACSSEKQIASSFSQEEIAQAINNDRWNFSAEHAMPSYGRSRSLTGGYAVTLRKDTMTVALPYYGKLNSPSGAYNQNPLDFQSTNFKIDKQEKKAGEWIITIKPANSEAQSLAFTFFDNGSAQLSIIMTNRSGINFSGKVTPVK